MWFIIQLLQQTKLHESHLIVYHDIYLAQILQQIDCFCLLVFFFYYYLTWLFWLYGKIMNVYVLA